MCTHTQRKGFLDSAIVNMCALTLRSSSSFTPMSFVELLDIIVFHSASVYSVEFAGFLGPDRDRERERFYYDPPKKDLRADKRPGTHRPHWSPPERQALLCCPE